MKTTKANRSRHKRSTAKADLEEILVFEEDWPCQYNTLSRDADGQFYLHDTGENTTAPQPATLMAVLEWYVEASRYSCGSWGHTFPIVEAALNEIRRWR